MTKQAKSQPKPAIELLTLDYQLAELPSSQHRAGLAGLVLMVKWLARQPNAKGVCRLTRLDAQGLTLEMDLPGLEALFDEVYGAILEERKSFKIWKDKEIIREEKYEELNKKGKITTKKLYVYEVVAPKGAFLLDFDPTANGDKGDWIKLWRDMVWEILRGIPATRNPFNGRAYKKSTDDAVKVWKELLKPLEHSIKLPSTYFIGAQEFNAEQASFKDRVHYQFLLHFWPYVTQTYVPTILNDKNEKDLPKGYNYVLVIPDVAELDFFCEEFPNLLKQRSGQSFRYRPKEAVIDLVVEGALNFLSRLSERLKILIGNQIISSIVLGVDIFHLKKQGDSINISSTTRLAPEMKMIDDYIRFQDIFKDLIFRRQILLNLVSHRPLHSRFDRLCCSLPIEQTFQSKLFCHDARKIFKEIEDENMQSLETISSEPENTKQTSTPNCEALIYKIIKAYVYGKLKSKYELDWDSVKNNPTKEKEYNEKKEKIAKEAFFAVRSRSGLDFIDYFVSSLCSIPQHLNEKQFSIVTNALYQETDKVRALTMLALSAQS